MRDGMFFSTRSLSVLCASALLGMGCVACRSTSSKGAVSAKGRGSAAPASLVAGGADGDGDRDGAPRGAQGAGVHDGDDGEALGLGRAASPTDFQAVAALVRAYYEAAAAEDSAKACSLIYYILAESMGEQYGGPPGPRYLQGASSCRAVLTIVFRRFHAQLAEPPRVTGVRVNGKLAYAVLDWSRLPAGYIEAKREGRLWKIDQALAAQMP